MAGRSTALGPRWLPDWHAVAARPWHGMACSGRLTRTWRECRCGRCSCRAPEGRAGREEDARHVAAPKLAAVRRPQQRLDVVGPAVDAANTAAIRRAVDAACARSLHASLHASGRSMHVVARPSVTCPRPRWVPSLLWPRCTAPHGSAQAAAAAPAAGLVPAATPASAPAATELQTCCRLPAAAMAQAVRRAVEASRSWPAA